MILIRTGAPISALILFPRLLMLCAALILGGCKSYGPIGTQNFDPTFSRTLEKNEQLLFSAQTDLVAGTFMEREEKLLPMKSGMLLLTSRRMMFAFWNESQKRYEPEIWTDYPAIARVKMHNNVLLKYVAIITTDGSKFTYMLNSKTVEQANSVLTEQIQKAHKARTSASPAI
ncbi:MAG: hypothetical protein OEV35_00140 [Gallionellaceae bacterium]|nr:hypothetical protein [Gallionellaceae bacterium]